MTERRLRLGLLGGTLDPVHAGHLAAAAAAREALDLDVVHLMPAHVPAQKPAPGASAWHRFAMAAMAVEGLDGLAVSDVELALPGPTFTWNTLHALAGRGYDRSQLFFITGADAFARIDTWHRYPELLDAAHFVVVTRPGHALDMEACCPEPARRRLRRAGAQPPDSAELAGDTQVWLVEAATPDVSSSAIRQRLGAGADVNDEMPSRVTQHIRRHGLYGTSASARTLHGED
jgi:nicotinate-nucleotide adenylyltransferase